MLRELCIEALRASATVKAYDRALTEYDESHVRSAALKGDALAGSVTGTRSYQVHLRWSGRVLDGSCSCPAWAKIRPTQRMRLCKHQVMLGLWALGYCAEAPVSPTPLDLSVLSREALEELVRGHLGCPELEVEVTQHLAAQGVGDPLAGVRAAVESYPDWDAPRGIAGDTVRWARSVNRAVQALVSGSAAPEVQIQGVALAIEACTDEYIAHDDSYGELRDFVQDACTLHAELCAQTPGAGREAARDVARWFAEEREFFNPEWEPELWGSWVAALTPEVLRAVLEERAALPAPKRPSATLQQATWKEQCSQHAAETARARGLLTRL